jgi:acyl carrier protein
MRPEELVARVFGLLPDAVADATGPETCEDWDSLGHLNLVLEMEQVYGIALSTDDALAITDVASMKRILAERGARW